MEYSQQQLSSLMSAAGVIALLLSKFGIVIPSDTLAFVLFSVWSLAWKGYGFYDRYKKGDLTLGGFRK